MLRYTTNDPQFIQKLISDYELDIVIGKVTISDFCSVSPDCFIWRLTLNDTDSYYLYAEDYISDLDYVINTLRDSMAIQPDTLLSFVPVKKPLRFEDSGPVLAASIYVPPKTVDEIMKVASGSGYDFVFLIKPS